MEVIHPNLCYKKQYTARNVKSLFVNGACWTDFCFKYNLTSLFLTAAVVQTMYTIIVKQNPFKDTPVPII